MNIDDDLNSCDLFIIVEFLFLLVFRICRVEFKIYDSAHTHLTSRLLGRASSASPASSSSPHNRSSAAKCSFNRTRLQLTSNALEKKKTSAVRSRPRRTIRKLSAPNENKSLPRRSSAARKPPTPTFPPRVLQPRRPSPSTFGFHGFFLLPPAADVVKALPPSVRKPQLPNAILLVAAS